MNPFATHCGTPVILDGGLATALENRGLELNDPLWSAKLLIEAPEEIRAVHTAFLESGADIIATVSYQASFEGFARRGIEADGARELLRLSVRLATEARDAFWAVASNRIGRRRPLVAASVGPFGAAQADGSEYTGDYPVDEGELYDFHGQRWHLLARSGADLLACETIPSGPEVEVLLRLLRETPDRWGWLSFSCRDGAHVADGTPLAEVARRCQSVPNVAAVGVNCVRTELVEPLVRTLRAATDLPLVAYPNAGGEWDAGSKTWCAPAHPVTWGRAARRWVAAGANGVGGCCRTGPDEIAAIRAAVTT